METVSRRILDDIDMQLLALLQENAQLGHAELAENVKLSIAAVHGRVKKLEQDGYIMRRVAILNQEKLDLELTTFIFISTNIHRKSELEALEAALQAMPEVLECHCITGEHDYLLKTVHKGRRDLERFIRSLNQLQVTRIQTTLVLRDVKSTTMLPLDV
ncbi:MAG: Lrp/AsnC family transcriptional regulator [Solibacillus sp.]